MMGMMEKRLLNFFKNGFAPLKPFLDVEGVASSTVYRKVKGLMLKGYLEKNGNEYKTTPRGVAAVKSTQNDFDWNLLERQIPHLKLIPKDLEIHRSIVELTIAAIVARQDEIRKSHHPTFILFGKTLKWKTWTFKFICHMLGIDPIGKICLVTAESGRSLFVRKKSDGAIAFKRDILDGPIVCFDELHKASWAVKEKIYNFVQGELYISFENEQLRMDPVPFVCYNPIEGERLGARINFDEGQYLRRSIICDFANVDIPDELKPKGELILEKARNLDGIKIPEHTDDCTRYQEAIWVQLEKGGISSS